MLLLRFFLFIMACVFQINSADIFSWFKRHTDENFTGASEVSLQRLEKTVDAEVPEVI